MAMGGTLLARRDSGGVVEWLMAPVLKTGRAQALVGSNPTPSAIPIFEFRFPIFDWPSTARYVHVNLRRGETQKEQVRSHCRRGAATFAGNSRPERFLESGQPV